MKDSKLRYTRRTCFIHNEKGTLVGKIQFQRDPHFHLWRVKYLSDSLPINSFDSNQQIRQKLKQAGYQWHWGKLRHYYGYQRI